MKNRYIDTGRHPGDAPFRLENTILRTLGKIGNHIGRDDQTDAIVPAPALGLIAGVLGADGLSLNQIVHDSADHFSVACIGAWSARTTVRDRPPFAFGRTWQVEDFPKAWWRRLESGKSIAVSEPSGPGMEPFSNLLFIPLLLGRGLFGFLGAEDMESDRLAPWTIDFIKVLRAMIELKIARCDAAHRMKALYDFLPNPTYSMNTAGEITVWNRALEILTGWKAQRLLGKGDCEHGRAFYNRAIPTSCNAILSSHPSSLEQFTACKFEDGDLYTSAYCSALPGGGAYLDGKTSKMYDINHRLVGAIHSVRDVTPEHQMKKSLHRSESMYQAITDFAGVGILLLRPQSVLYCNDTFRRLLDREPPITLEHIVNWIHPEDREECLGWIRNIFEGADGDIRIELRSAPNPRSAFYQAYAKRMDYEEEPTVHVIIHDITQQKEAELRMHHEDRLSALGVMAAGIAHELSQPLNTIRIIIDGFLFGRDRGWRLDPQELDEGFDSVSRQVSRMAEVIQNVKNFARINPQVSAVPVEPSRAIENVLSMIGRQLAAHHIHLKKRYNHHDQHVLGRENRLEQVIMNLVVNAMQALDASQKPDKYLWIRTRNDDRWVAIEISDNATGISDSLKKKIFNPFFTTKDVGQGTGLGLSISQSIISEFGGRIAVHNNRRGGASFTIRLPACGVQQ